jgi:predicted lipoprotein with Yx(FWY)xxD motif
MYRHRFLSLVCLVTVASCGKSVATSSVAADSAPAASPVQTVDSDAGKILADASGLSLYTYDHDTTSQSTCYQGCAHVWPPALTTLASVAAPLGLTTRNDGKVQLTYGGKPLYLYAGDSAQGDVNGDGLGGIWHLVHPAPVAMPTALLRTTIQVAVTKVIPTQAEAASFVDVGADGNGTDEVDSSLCKSSVLVDVEKTICDGQKFTLSFGHVVNGPTSYQLVDKASGHQFEMDCVKPASSLIGPDEVKLLTCSQKLPQGGAL